MDHDPITGEQTLPFYLTSFAAAANGGGEDDDDRDDEDLDNDEDDEQDEDADKSDDELRQELKEARAQLKRDRDRSARRRKREARERAEEASKPKPKDKSEDDGPDLDTVRHEARTEGEKAGLTRAKRAEAKSSLLAAGVSPERVAKAVGLIDLDELDLDDDGLDGVEDAIEDLRKEWPELFAKKRNRRDSVAGDRGADGERQRKALTPSERQAALVTGGSR